MIDVEKLYKEKTATEIALEMLNQVVEYTRQHGVKCSVNTLYWVNNMIGVTAYIDYEIDKRLVTVITSRDGLQLIIYLYNDGMLYHEIRSLHRG